MSPRTVDYYTQLGLLREAARSPGKHRLYSDEAVQIIRIVKELQKQHFTLEEICRLLVCKENGDFFTKAVNIRRNLDNLQKEVTELYPVLKSNGSDQQIKVVSQELVTKALQIVQALMLLLGDPSML